MNQLIDNEWSKISKLLSSGEVAMLLGTDKEIILLVVIDHSRVITDIAGAAHFAPHMLR